MKILYIFFVTAFLAAGLGTCLVLTYWHHRVECAAIQQVLDERVKARQVLNAQQFSYVVERGDTIPQIARQFGVSVKTLLTFNHITFLQGIRVGEKLENPQAFETAISDYIDELGKIDPSACPRKFRGAWQDYVESWELKKDPIIQKQNQLDTSATKVEGHLGLSLGVSEYGGQIGGELDRPNLHSAAERLEKLDNDEAWLQCKRAALDFGVFAQ